MRAIQPAWHEFTANLLFAEHDLAPYFAADSQVKAGGGSKAARFELAGESWNVTLYYQFSGIVHPGRSLATGTEFRIDEVREFRLQVSRASEEDEAGQQSFNAHLSPRWQGMKVEKEDAARFYECNRSDAVARACDAVPAVARAVREVLERDDLTTAQKQEIAETLSTRGLNIEIESAVTVKKPD